ncbi:uncharacterized protein [Aristolochia californica]|uniref:uncharacterized protein n=1 Tax=Aristolochia californica TaxID=171875 RepID=UPI0035D97B18
MSGTVVNDSVANSSAESNTVKMVNPIVVEFIKCDCCGLTEECTPAYITRVTERFHGRWICGLCSEAVKDEIYRSERLIGMEEALSRHISFCKKFQSSTPKNSTEHLITAMRHILRRSLDSPRAMRTIPKSPARDGGGVSRASLSRSGSCMPTLAG